MSGAAQPAAAADPPLPFEIVEANGALLASNGAASMQVLVSEGGRLVRRRAVKVSAGTNRQARVEWAMATLDGVRVYFDGANVIVTRQDLQP